MKTQARLSIDTGYAIVEMALEDEPCHLTLFYARAHE